MHPLLWEDRLLHRMGEKLSLTAVKQACIILLIENPKRLTERKNGMREFTYTIKNAYGIHARPAGNLVQTACEFVSSIQLKCGARTADLKKIMAVMGMEVKQGQAVTVVCEGPDQDQAISVLMEFFHEKL
jgi:phosphocarrier protein